MPVTGGIEVTVRLNEPVSLNIDFRANEAEMVALVGPSGSGKSTILRTVAGLEKPLDGKIIVGGQRWFDSERGIFVSVRQRRVGMVFQSYALFPHLSALENIAQAITNHEGREKFGIAREYLARVNLEGLGERRPGQMSGGQRQRVAVARALARQPDVLLLDEPFSAVDKVTRTRLQRELVELRASLSIPIILVTHDIEEAARLADRIAVLHEGHILQMDSHKRLSRFPANSSVARLVGIRNIFRGKIERVHEGRNKIRLQWGKTSLEAEYHKDFGAGQSVTWCIQSDGIVVHRRNRPSRGEHENPVFGRVVEVFQFGQTTEITVDVGDPNAHPLHCSIPTHVAARNDICVGANIGLSLKSDMIHVMSVAQS